MGASLEIPKISISWRAKDKDRILQIQGLPPVAQV
jgi:hypothetical protein